MIDTIKSIGVLDRIHPNIREQSREDFDMYGILFRPIIGPNDIRYCASLRNLKIELRGDKLIIQNSIHRFKKGTNSCDFTQSQLIDTIDEVDSIFNGAFSSSKLVKVDYGVNIENTNLGYKDWLNFKGKSFRDMYCVKKSKSYGSKVYFTEYSLKGYDKVYEQCRGGPIRDKQCTRIEKSIKRMRHLRSRSNPIVINTIGDLKMRSNIQLLADDLVANFGLIKRKTKRDYSELKTNQLKDISIMEDDFLRELLKANKEDSYKKIRTKYNKLIRDISNEYDDSDLNLIKSKAYSLLAS